MSDAKFEEYYKTAILPAATVSDLSEALYTKESLEWVWRAARASTDAEWRALVEKLVGALQEYSCGSDCNPGTYKDGSCVNANSGCGKIARQALAEAKLRGVV